MIPRHPLSDAVAPELLPWGEGLATIDWEKMTPGPARDYRDKECRRVCMAEALKRDLVPATDFSTIYVRDDAVARQVASVIAGRIGAHVNPAPWWV